MAELSTKKISPYVIDMIDFLRRHDEIHAESVSSAVVSEMSDLSREVGALYEKLRYAVDNKEEHSFRRYAVRRALRRVSLFSNDPNRLLDILIADLVRGGYLKGGELGSKEMAEAKQSLTTFIDLQSRLRSSYDTATYYTYRKYLLDIVAGAIEDALYDNSREEAIVVMLARIAETVIEGEELLEQDEEKRKIIFYVAAWRSLFAADSALLRYKLWLIVCPQWDQMDEQGIANAIAEFPKILNRINYLIGHPLGASILPRLHDLSIAHTLLYDMVSKYGTGVEAVINDTELFATRIRECIEDRYHRDLTRARRRSLRAILYIFVTKSMLAFGVESLYIFVWKQSLNYVALVINLITHPMLLLFLTGGLHRPKARNTERAILLTSAIAFGSTITPIVITKEKRGIVTDIALGLYFAFLGVSIIGIIGFLNAIQFHSVDIGIFLLFLLLVLYFGFRIRSSAYRMRFSSTKESFLRTLMELLLLPLISVGRWMSLRFENINIAVLVLDFFIEVPFRLLLRFLDIFTRLLERKRDEIYTP